MVHPHGTAANVRAEMARHGKTQGDLAPILGVTRQGVSRRLTGQTAFNVDEILALAKYFGVSAASLIGEATDAVSA